MIGILIILICLSKLSIYIGGPSYIYLFDSHYLLEYGSNNMHKQMNWIILCVGMFVWCCNRIDLLCVWRRKWYSLGSWGIQIWSSWLATAVKMKKGFLFMSSCHVAAWKTIYSKVRPLFCFPSPYMLSCFTISKILYKIIFYFVGIITQGQINYV